MFTLWNVRVFRASTISLRTLRFDPSAVQEHVVGLLAGAAPMSARMKWAGDDRSRISPFSRPDD